jgi:hypothetical protein
MRKVIFLTLFLLVFLFSARETHAALLTIDKSGKIIWNVLSYESSLSVPKNNLEVKSVTDNQETNKLISLNMEGEKVSLKVGEENELDVTNVPGDLVEIEERNDVKKIEIGVIENKFSIKEGGIVALSSYPINIDPVESRLSLLTPSGKKYLAIFPHEAVQIALRSKYVSKVEGDSFNINEEGKDISYLISGQKIINLFNVFKLGIPVTANVSASSGEILSVNQPIWLKFIGFMFS